MAVVLSFDLILMNKTRILIFVVCYKAESTIKRVLDRIPADMWNSERFTTEVLIIDDQSSDQTFAKAHLYSLEHPERTIHVLYNPRNLGYGGNQKVGYHYAIQNNFDVVVLLHGDGQYAPEYLPQMADPILKGEADAVFGSRMLQKRDALMGKMPFYKWIGNQILTGLQNRILKARLSEFHSGYRAYRVSALKDLPSEYNADYFDFDTDIIIQLLDTGKRIAEIPIPTFYGDEICRVNGVRYACRILSSCLLSRLNQAGLYYHPKFDYVADPNMVYQSKLGYCSSHQFAFSRVQAGATVLDIGCGPGYMAEAMAGKGARVISIDKHLTPLTRAHSIKSIETDIENYTFENIDENVDMVLLLDIIEHLKQPEQFLTRMRHAFAGRCPDILITTGNVGYFPVRLNLLFGAFHFGKRGILDMDHTRLFTFSSLARLLKNYGYKIVQINGLPTPFPLALGNRKIAHGLVALNRFLICLCRGLFSYQIAIQAKPLPTLDSLLRQAHAGREKRLLENTEETPL